MDSSMNTPLTLDLLNRGEEDGMDPAGVGEQPIGVDDLTFLSIRVFPPQSPMEIPLDFITYESVQSQNFNNDNVDCNDFERNNTPETVSDSRDELDNGRRSRDILTLTSSNIEEVSESNGNSEGTIRAEQNNNGEIFSFHQPIGADRNQVQAYNVSYQEQDSRHRPQDNGTYQLEFYDMCGISFTDTNENNYRTGESLVIDSESTRPEYQESDYQQNNTEIVSSTSSGKSSLANNGESEECQMEEIDANPQALPIWPAKPRKSKPLGRRRPKNPIPLLRTSSNNKRYSKKGILNSSPPSKDYQYIRLPKSEGFRKVSGSDSDELPTSTTTTEEDNRLRYIGESASGQCQQYFIVETMATDPLNSVTNALQTITTSASSLVPQGEYVMADGYKEDSSNMSTLTSEDSADPLAEIGYPKICVEEEERRRSEADTGRVHHFLGRKRARVGSIPKKYARVCISDEEMEKKRTRANEQERTRMHNLNSALRELRKHLPQRHPLAKRRSKINTLRLAIEYIRELDERLGLSF